MTATPIKNIAISVGVIIIVFLTVGLILILTNHAEQGNNLLSIAIGAFGGGGAATAAVHNTNGIDKPPSPKP